MSRNSTGTEKQPRLFGFEIDLSKLVQDESVGLDKNGKLVGGRSERTGSEKINVVTPASMPKERTSSDPTAWQKWLG